MIQIPKISQVTPPELGSSFLDYLVHINDRMRNENAENLRLFAQLVLKILLFEN